VSTVVLPGLREPGYVHDLQGCVLKANRDLAKSGKEVKI
jgi:hypothetical protein